MRALRHPLPVWLGLLVLAAGAVVAGRPGDASANPAGWQVGRVRFEPISPEGSSFTLDGLGEYRGAVEVARTPQGLAVVNEVGLDDYLRGLAEMPSSWPAEALRAQAIAARTYLLWEAFSGTRTAYRAAGAQICATQSCQVYVGLAKERGPSGERWVQAVGDTSGQVLLYQGRVVLAKYSSSNGGRSVAGNRPYLRAVDDPDDATSPLHQWRSALALEDVRRTFAVVDPLVSVADAGGAVVLTSQGADGHTAELRLPKGDFRTRLNAALPAPGGLPKALPSNRFAVSTQGSSVVVDGLGYGHGIGMSQYGALGKALRGLSAADILAAYYGGIRPTQFEPGQLPPSVRVALSLDRAAVRVTSTSPFRVVDEAGSPLAMLAAGSWEVRPGADGKVDVRPPEGSGGPVGLDQVAVEAASPGAPPVVRFRISAPARVQLTVSGDGLAPVASEPRVVTAGEVAQALPVAVPPGDYQVVVQADAGGGRVASAPVVFRVDERGVARSLPSSAAAAGGPGGGAAGLAAPRAEDPAAALAGAARQPDAPPAAATGSAVFLLLTVAAALCVRAVGERRRVAREIIARAGASR